MKTVTGQFIYVTTTKKEYQVEWAYDRNTKSVQIMNSKDLPSQIHSYRLINQATQEFKKFLEYDNDESMSTSLFKMVILSEYETARLKAQVRALEIQEIENRPRPTYHR